MKNKFIIKGYGTSVLGDVWFIGNVRYIFPNNAFIETEECQIYFENYLICRKWIENMGDDIEFPETMKGFR